MHGAIFPFIVRVMSWQLYSISNNLRQASIPGFVKFSDIKYFYLIDICLLPFLCTVSSPEYVICGDVFVEAVCDGGVGVAADKRGVGVGHRLGDVTSQQGEDDQ